MVIAILGIGEAGGALARDLIAKGVQVRGWDPEPRNLPHELEFAAEQSCCCIECRYCAQRQLGVGRN